MGLDMISQRLRIAGRSLEGALPILFGFSLNKAWINLAIPYMPAQVPGNALLSFDMFFALASIALAALSLHVVPKTLRSVLFPAAAACLLVSSVLLALCFALSIQASSIVVVATGLSVVGVVGMAMLWTDVLAVFNPARTALFVGGATALSYFFVFALEEVTPVRKFVVLTMLLLVSFICYGFGSRKAVSEQVGDKIRRCRPVFPSKAVTFIAAYSFSYGLMSPSATGLGGPHHLAQLVAALTVVAFVLIDTKRFRLRVLYNLALPMMVCGLLLAALVPGMPSAFVAASFDISYASMGIMLTLVACGISYSTGYSVLWIFGLLVFVQFLAKTLGVFLNDTYSFELSAVGLGGLFPMSAIVLVLLASVVMLSEKSIFSRWGTAFPVADESEKEMLDGMKLRIDDLSTSYGLTQREIEVLHLLAQGKTNAEIGQDMFIAEGTVKAHVQHIYQKLDVHSRKELFALL